MQFDRTAYQVAGDVVAVRQLDREEVGSGIRIRIRDNHAIGETSLAIHRRRALYLPLGRTEHSVVGDGRPVDLDAASTVVNVLEVAEEISVLLDTPGNSKVSLRSS